MLAAVPLPHGRRAVSRPLPRSVLLVALAVAGCDRVESDFRVHLRPQTPLDQQPFEGDVSVKLAITEPAGRVLIPLADADDPGQLAAEGIAPLEQAWLGLLLESPPDHSTAFDPAAVRAWGETGPFDLALGGDEIEAPILVAAYARMGDLDLLPSGTSGHGAALALSPGGDAWLFGGADTPGGPALARMLHLADLDSGDWQFVDAGAMPAVSGASARYGATATPIELEGTAAILVAGGRADGTAPGGNLATAFAVDASTGEVLWTDDVLQQARSGHRALLLDNDRVLLIGGFEGDGTPLEAASFEVFDPRWLASDAGDPLAIPPHGFGLADLGPDGVLACGGTLPGNGPAEPAPAAVCDRISLLGSVETAADLPEARTGLALGAAGSGQVLACGGRAAIGGAPTDTAWLYDPDGQAWVATGPLVHPRAGHVVIPALDGRALVIGGVDEDGPVECIERFDPGTGTFTEVECTGTGSGADPQVATSPRGLALVLSGGQTEGRAYGVVSLGPR